MGSIWIVQNVPRSPRIEYLDAGRLEISHVPRYNRHAMNQCRCCYQRIPMRSWIRHMQLCASLSNGNIDRENTTSECRQHMVIEPGAKHRSLRWVTPLDQEYPSFQFQNSDGRQKHICCRNATRPYPDVLVSLAGFCFPQFGNNIGVQQVHQDKSAGRQRSPIKRGGSKSMSATPGIASRSTMLF